MALEEYIPTEWVNGVAPAINAENLNHIEQGIKNITSSVISNQWYDPNTKTLYLTDVPTTSPTD